MKKLIFTMLSISLALTACQMNELDNPGPEDFRNTISFNAADFIQEESPETKASIQGGTFVWSNGDTLGIFPNSGSQVYFSMEGGGGATSATFDGGGWDFKPSAVYRSYFPLVGEFYLDQTNIPVNYSGQRQVGNDNADNIGPCVFMYTPATSAADGKLNFSFKHLSLVIKPKITLPAGKYTKLTLTLDEPLFVTKGHYDLTASKPEIIGDNFSKTISLDLDVTLASESQLIAYVMCAHINMTGKTLIISVTKDDGTTYNAPRSIAKEYYAGTIYSLSVTGTEGPALNEIRYSVADGTTDGTIAFTPSAYKLSEETGNELDIANCVLPEDNGGVGILRFKAPVTEIDEYAFSNTNIKEIILPDCVETIHQGAFEDCQLLSDATLGASLKSIGSYSFYGTSLSSITLPEGLERIGAFAFASTLLESITIPESVSHLGFREESPLSLAPLGNPFGNCPNLKRFKGKFSTQDGRALVENNKNGNSYFVSFATNGMDGQPYHVPEVYAVSPYAFYNATIGSVTFGGVETIFTYAFNNCGQLKSVFIPSNLTRIGGYAFGGCSALEFIEINSTQVPTAYDSQGHMFDGSSCPIYVRSSLVDAYKTAAFWSDYEARYHFKQPEYAIWYKTNDGSDAPETLPDGFSRADLPDGTKVIKYGSNITEIPDNFFSNAYNLTEVFIPYEVVSIGNNAFANCQNLKNVHFGNKLTTIGMEAFQSCISLKSIDLPESLTTLSTHAFHNCSKITTVRIPDALTLVSDNPFFLCDGLSSFTGTNNMISEDGRCLVKNGTIVSFATAGLEDQIYTIPEGITSIGNQAFVKANFSSVIIPETVSSIGWAAFYDNTHLTTIDIPSSVTSMSSWVFNECSALYKVTLHNTTPPTLGTGVFNGTNSSLSIFVPAGSVEAYKTNSSWIAALSSVNVIQAIPTE